MVVNVTVGSLWHRDYHHYSRIRNNNSESGGWLTFLCWSAAVWTWMLLSIKSESSRGRGSRGRGNVPDGLEPCTGRPGRRRSRHQGSSEVVLRHLSIMTSDLKALFNDTSAVVQFIVSAQMALFPSSGVCIITHRKQDKNGPLIGSIPRKRAGSNQSQRQENNKRSWSEQRKLKPPLRDRWELHSFRSAGVKLYKPPMLKTFRNFPHPEDEPWNNCYLRTCGTN